IITKPEIKEFFEDRNKRSINITALKVWEEEGELFEADDEILASLEHMKSKAYKNDFNSRSISRI
ncbi:104_t:CDS:2, partial [Funneliformis geosporum]